MRVYNTLSRQKEVFEPIEDGKVKMYVCGPTVYNYIHIGNARPYVVFDTVRRYLEFKGYEVTYVQNFTDIDDKIINEANKENTTSDEIAKRYIQEAFKDADGLNVKRATVHPLVTNEISEIVEMIGTLIEKGFAYETNGSVYFNTDTFNHYGKLSLKNIEELRAGARVKVDEEKQNPLDFILWKPHKEGEPYWDSPWGKGRPGWHIECSVMAKKYLGDTIDIHAGGEDLVFPHHENEIAQSEAANGKTFAKYWLHNGFINIDNQKMSKSKGNFFTLREISEKIPYEIIRFYILSAHYRSPLNFSEALLEAAGNGLDRIKNAILNLNYFQQYNSIAELKPEEKELLESISSFEKQFIEAMDDDFNTANAISAIYDLIKFSNININAESSKEFAKTAKEQINKLCSVLGLLESEGNTDSKLSEKVEKMLNDRKEARQRKDWAAADAIRDALSDMGVLIEDTPSGTRWSLKG